MLKSKILQSFSRGLDLETSAVEIQPGFTPNANNVYINQDGGIESIPGFKVIGSGSSPSSPALPLIDYYAVTPPDRSFTTLLVADGKTICTFAMTGYGVAGTEIGNVGWGGDAGVPTFSVWDAGRSQASQVTFTTYEDTVYILDAENDLTYDLSSNLFESSGTTPNTAAPGVDTGPPHGLILGIFGDSMWVADDSNPMSVVFSDPGNITGTGSWPVDNQVTLGSSPGDSIIGGMSIGDGLVVFTRNTTYLIYDSLTGANSVIDSQHGCESRRSIVMVDGLIYGVCRDGIFETDGRTPLRIISGLVDKLFRFERPDLSTASACELYGHYYVSYDRGAGEYITLDVSIREPSPKPILSSSYPSRLWMRWDATFPTSGTAESPTDGTIETIYSGPATPGPPAAFFVDVNAVSDDTDAIAADFTGTIIKQAFQGGFFTHVKIDHDLESIVMDPVAFDFYYDMPPTSFGEPSVMKRMRKIRLLGRGTLTAEVRPDFSDAIIFTHDFSFPEGGWGDGNWGDLIWGSFGKTIFDEWASVNAPRARYFSVRIKGTSNDDVVIGSTIDGPGSPSQSSESTDASVGVAAIYQAEVFFVPSSRLRRGALTA